MPPRIPSLLLALVLAHPLGAQLVPLKSTPTPVGDQFLFLPSQNFGRAGLGIASADPLRDPFRNPALSSGGPHLRLTASPVLYHNTLGTVGGTTLPVSATVEHSGWFGAFAWASQELDEEPIEVFARPTEVQGSVVEDEDRRNRYFLGSVGRRFAATGTSVGVQFLRGELGILTGTFDLYPKSLGVVQEGDMEGLTVGLVQELGRERTLEGTFSRTLVSMENEVARWGWTDPGMPGGPRETETWTDVERDEARTTRGQLRYTQPVAAKGLRLGAVVGVLDRQQEETPRYDLVNIPRDPGSARIYEIGIGAETLWHDPLLGWELSFQPGSADTRALADSTYVTPSGATVRPGDPATDSHFSFRNWRLAGGIQVPVGSGAFQVGLALHRYKFDMTQEDHLFEKTRERDEAWMELLPSAGARVALGPVDLGYSVRLVAKGLAPCRPSSFRHRCQGREELFWDTELAVAPSEPAHIPDFRVTTHHFTVSVRTGR